MARGVAHVLAPHRIEVAGDSATAHGHSRALVHGDGGWRALRVSANAWRFRRTPAGWRIAARTNRPLDGADAARSLLAPPPPADPPAPAPG